MKSSIRYSALALSAAAISGASVVGSTEAVYWPALSRLSGENSQSVLAAAAAANRADLVQVAANRRYRDGSFIGPVYDAYYGLVQVQANVRGGSLVSIDVLQYPAHRSTSRAINNHALPMLESEVIRAQSIHVDIISGATLT